MNFHDGFSVRWGYSPWLSMGQGPELMDSVALIRDAPILFAVTILPDTHKPMYEVAIEIYQARCTIKAALLVKTIS
jgi:hypothetical protein